MPRRLLLVNIVLAAVSALCIVVIAKQLTSSRPAPSARNRPAPAATTEPAPGGDSRQPMQAYNVIAARNMFSPTRNEATGPASAGAAPSLAVKPVMHGVVLREGSPIAYLEDPLTKRTAGYRIGDPIAGGTVQTISADTVVIARPDGMVDVRLRDPSKPRPAPAPPGQGQPGQQQPLPGQSPAGGQLPNQGIQPVTGPGQPPPRVFAPPGMPVVPQVPQQPIPPPAAVQAPVPGQPIPFSRPSPSLGRRMPPIPQDPSGQPQPAPNQ